MFASSNKGGASMRDAIWQGIDTDTRDFVRKMVRERKMGNRLKTAALHWLIACRDAGLSTALDADLADPRYTELFEARLAAVIVGIDRVRRRHTAPVRDGLRVYAVAVEQGMRTRPVPPAALPNPIAWPLSVSAARGQLPSDDQQKLTAVDALLLRLATQQWAGDGDAMTKRSDGHRRKTTMAHTSQVRLRALMDDFVRQGRIRQWEPFTLDGLLTPEHVVEFLYYSSKLDGTYYDIKTIKQSEMLLVDYLYRARNCGREPIEIVSAERETALRAAILAEQDNQHKWHKRGTKHSNSGRTKWYPTLDQVTTAIAALEEQIARIEERWAKKRISREECWRELRDAVLALCALYGMWRVDTAATLSLLHLTHFRSTNSVLDKNGFAVIANSVRAKNTTAEWYPFVAELTLSPVVVRLITKLLAFEGRSLAQPLRDGERPVHLRAGSGARWGKDPVLSGDLVVAPIFRAAIDDPAGLTHAGVENILERQLRRLHYGATNPHTLRAAGAIYWSFVVGMPEALVMHLGLWEDATTLRECYARIAADDQRNLIAGFLPADPGVTPPRVHGRREKAAVTALGVLGQMLEKPTGAHEARRLLAELRRSYETIDQTIAAELGRRWEPVRPDPLLPGERERVDEELRARGCQGGMEEVLGRRLFPHGVLRDLALDADRNRALPPAIRSSWRLVPPAPVALDAPLSEQPREVA